MGHPHDPLAAENAELAHHGLPTQREGRGWFNNYSRAGINADEIGRSGIEANEAARFN
jgi:hypothetical protein